MATGKPVLFLGVLPKKSHVLKALIAAEKLLDSVAYVNKEGDTAEVLQLIRLAKMEVTPSK
jgi:hypothetical protein